MMRPTTKYFIFGQGRSGTTLLKQLINSHPEITCDGELLNMKDGYINNKYLLKFAYRLPGYYFNYHVSQSKTKVYGFTLLYHQCRNPEKLVRQMYNSGWKIINVHRESVMAQALSFLVAMKTNNWHNWHGKHVEARQIYIDPTVFSNRIKLLKNLKQAEQQLLQRYNYLKIIYEEDLSNENTWQSTADTIFHYLGQNSFPVKATLKRTYPKPYSEIVENYKELEALMKKEINK